MSTDATKPVEQNAKEIKTDLDKGHLNDGATLLRQSYLDYMKGGGDDAKFWSTIKTAGHLTDGDMQHLSLAFARSNFDAMAGSSWTGTGFIDSTSLGKFDAGLRNAGSTPESQFAQKMDGYLKQALDNDGAFHHGFFDIDMETNLHGTGNYISQDALNDRISKIDNEDKGRALTGDMTRALDAKGQDGRTLFDKITNGKPGMTDDMLRKAGDNLGAYSPDEQKVIKSMLKGLDDTSSSEGIAMSNLRDPSKDNQILKTRLDQIEKDPQFSPADAPQAPGQPGKLTPDQAKAGLDALLELPKETRDKIAGQDGKVTRKTVDDYLNDQTNANGMSQNQRKALQDLRDGLPQDGSGVTLGDIAKAGGYTKPDGSLDDAAVKKHMDEVHQSSANLLTALHDNVPGKGLVDDKGNISQDALNARLEQIKKDSQQQGATPLDQNKEYQTLQALNQHFGDMSSDGKTITAADRDRFAVTMAGQDKFQGFKGDGTPQQPAGPDAQQVQKDGDQIINDAQGKTVKFGKGPIIDQAMQLLQERAKTTGEPVNDKAARQLLADMAKANKWPGSEAQWNAYVNDGRTSHLPKELNYAMKANMDMIVPGPSSPEQIQKKVGAAADKAVPVPDLKLTDDQKKAAVAKIPELAKQPPEQWNDIIARNPGVFKDIFNPDQAAALKARQDQMAAYAKAVLDYIQSKQNPQPAPAPKSGDIPD